MVMSALVGGGLVFVASCALLNERTVDQLAQWPLTATQHQELADEYRKEAADARAIAARHLADASVYRDAANSGSIPAEARDEMSAHCVALARDYEQAARQYDALAENHESLAEGRRRGLPRDLQDDRPY